VCLFRARERRDILIRRRQLEKATSHPRLRNITLTARDDHRQAFLRAAARFYRLAERG